MLTTLRGDFQRYRILRGININNRAEGPIERIVSSKIRVKSNVAVPGSLKRGPKLLSLTYADPLSLELRGAKPGYMSMVGVEQVFLGRCHGRQDLER